MSKEKENKSEKEPLIEKKYRKYIYIFFVVIFLFAVFPPFNQYGELDVNHWGLYGDFIGGLFGTLLTAGTIIILIYYNNKIIKQANEQNQNQLDKIQNQIDNAENQHKEQIKHLKDEYKLNLITKNIELQLSRVPKYNDVKLLYKSFKGFDHIDKDNLKNIQTQINKLLVGSYEQFQSELEIDDVSLNYKIFILKLEINNNYVKYIIKILENIELLNDIDKSYIIDYKFELLEKIDLAFLFYYFVISILDNEINSRDTPKKSHIEEMELIIKYFKREFIVQNFIFAKKVENINFITLITKYLS